MPHINHEPPYPSVAPTLTEITVRLQAIEKWRERLDRDGLPRAFAVMEERQAVQQRRSDQTDQRLEKMENQIAANHRELSDRANKIERTLDERQGFLTGTKTMVLLATAAMGSTASVIMTLLVR